MGKDNELIDAARSGNVTVVEKLLLIKAKRSGPLASLRRGPGANVQDICGYSALHHAALNGHIEIVALLLSHDASPNLPDSRGSSPLHLAAWAGHHEIVKLLLTNQYRPANPNLQTVDRETPLHCAAQHGHTECLTILLLHGADANVPNSKCETPLDLAAQYGRLQVVNILINEHPELLVHYKYGNLVDYSPLHLASRNGHKAIVETLLSAGVDVNLQTPSGTALHEAALCGKESVVLTLLKAGANLNSVDNDGRTVSDLLEQFPPHVTKGILAVITNHKSSKSHNSERNYSSIGHHNDNKKSKNKFHRDRNPQECETNENIGNFITLNDNNKDYFNAAIKSKSFSSSDGNHFYISMAPSDFKHTPPKKPPRRNYSFSPTNLQSNVMMTKSLDISDGNNFHDENLTSSSAYEYLCLSQSGYDSNQLESSTDQYMEMNSPKSNNTYYENLSTGMRILNPNRKLRRNKNRNSDDYSMGKLPQKKIMSYIVINDTIPISPTHYNQPPTPEHPPPTPIQAENLIHEIIRPLSQVYKRRSKEFSEIGTSPPDNLCTSLGASSASLSSSFSLSDRSVSTDCVEEFVGDVPFAGLLKGSTSSNIEPTNIFNYKSGQIERPKTLKTSNDEIFYQQQQHTVQQQNHESQVINNISSTTQTNQNNYDLNSIDVLSPFDEQEEWSKISEIITSFGESLFQDTNSKVEFDFTKNNMFLFKKNSFSGGGLCGAGALGPNTSQLQSSSNDLTLNQINVTKWLDEIGLSHLKCNLIENGYDDIEFINNILDEDDCESLNIAENDVPILTNAIKNLPQPSTLALNNSVNNVENQNVNNNLPQSLTLEKWLNDIRLENYIETFKKNLYTDIPRIFRIWEVELQTVLEINKLGHRKRILYSIYGCKNSPQYNKNTEIELQQRKNLNKHSELILRSCKTHSDASIKTDRGNDIKVVDDQQIALISSNNTNNISTNTHNQQRYIHRKKNRPAPKPPTYLPNLEIRAPSELLLGFPTGLKTQWRHSADTFISSYVKYKAYYLGSTVVKELRGTESTRKSIQKLKRGERLTNNHISDTTATTTNKDTLTLIRQPIFLAISFCGVKFLDIETQKVICEHEIKNIDCACQDADDLKHFAYITKDIDTHYCHVFNVDSMDLATEIILTLGQAFEVAYQIALREISPSTPSHHQNAIPANTNSSDEQSSTAVTRSSYTKSLIV